MSSDKKKITLLSSDGKSFEMDIVVANQSEFLTHLIEDCGTDDAIPFPNVTSTILVKVIEYCTKHANHTKLDALDETTKIDEELKKWDADFINVDQGVLYDILMASNFLNIKGLLQLACQRVANMIKGKSTEEIRKIFHIKNDFSPEEEQQVRQENPWAFED